MDITHAILSLRPEATWALNGDTYEGLEWLDENQTKPTEEEITQELENLRAAEPMRLLRIERDRLIAETDWWALSDRTPTQAQLDYRQALRDLPSTATPVLDSTTKIGISGVDWPVKP